MTTPKQAVALVDKRPFFEKALTHGLAKGIIDVSRCNVIIADGAKGTVQVATHFATPHLQAELDNARKRIVTLVSLYLEEASGGDLDAAARSLQENSFLSHSRGGNDMLKRLYAMPETVMSGDIKSQSLIDFQNERTLLKPTSLAAYRKELKRRQEAVDITAAAHWFRDDLRVPPAALDYLSVESIIRTAILARHAGLDKAPDHAEFAKLVTAIRNQPQPGGKLKIARTLLDDVPDPHHAIAETIRRDIEKLDGPLILNTANAIDVVLNIIVERYFLRDADLDDIDSFAGFVSEQWQAAMKGKDDPYSRLTLFMCLATGAKPKTMVTDAEARTMVRQVRKAGFNSTAVADFVNAAAPFEIKDNLLALWNEEFLPEARERLIDETDISLQRAMMFLTENLNVKPKPKSAK
ncbi:hypothetical protein QN362_13885 [Actimicrobium sp. CCC2.4]|uniref:hypothetical protein n=1 Tax=Actimicrobium sp. CCC2.4 TaxID=3048606 RepID=UPI002AC8CB1F|nr:hypothetical protein [Actimicrobium sp. CCC2.4]MEB0136426.1 hypothetical protein [Actimicrobium sp. CCC2.4]WPX31245.1 hypothetical protein RHM62_13440 [Actimicrobium sp. CCC2.4]